MTHRSVLMIAEYSATAVDCCGQHLAARTGRQSTIRDTTSQIRIVAGL